MENENDLLTHYHLLVLGALKKCHISPHHPLFEDYLQISRWLLIETHREFIQKKKELTSFHNYVYQRICWKITDEIRKEINYTNKLLIEETDKETTTYFDTLPTPSQEDWLEMNDLLEKISQLLTQKEQLYLQEAYLNELTITEIAHKYHVSRKTVYQWREKVAQKSLPFFKNRVTL